MGVVLAPSHDADGDGHFDTYIQGETIHVDMQFTEPVEVTGDGDAVRLRLDLGADDTDPGNSRKLLKNPSVIYGGLVLRFFRGVGPEGRGRGVRRGRRRGRADAGPGCGGRRDGDAVLRGGTRQVLEAAVRRTLVCVSPVVEGRSPTQCPGSGGVGRDAWSPARKIPARGTAC